LTVKRPFDKMPFNSFSFLEDTMYRRLESKIMKIETKEAASDAECVCTCKTEKPKDGPPKPAATSSSTQISDNYRING